MTATQPTAWGRADYDPHSDADEWLARSPRSGPAVDTVLDPQFARRVATGLLQLPFATWNFGDSVAFDALVETTERTGEEHWATFVRAWGRSWATRATPYARLDCTAPGRALVKVAERYRDGILMDALGELSDFLRARPVLFGAYETWAAAPLLSPYGGAPLGADDLEWLERPPGCICVDCLHFDAPFFVRLGVATDRVDLIEDGTRQALAYIDALQDSSGLFDHFRLAGTDRRFGPGWGRGQGWALLGLLDVVEDHPDPESDEVRAIAESARVLIGAMTSLQRPDGHWPVIVTSPESGDEFSTTAFMVAGISRAVRLGVADRAMVADCLGRAGEAMRRSFDAHGNLTMVSAAVYASTIPEHYAHVPRGHVVPWGQGPALLALWESLGEGRE